MIYIITIHNYSIDPIFLSKIQKCLGIFVMFDPSTIGDGMNGELPPDVIDAHELERACEGIDLVVVNGKVAVESGTVTGDAVGRVRRWEL